MKISLIQMPSEHASPRLLISFRQFERDRTLLSYKSDSAVLNAEAYVKAKSNVPLARYDAGVINFDLHLLGGV